MLFDLLGIQLKGEGQVGYACNDNAGGDSRRLFDLIQTQIVGVTQTPTSQTVDVV